MSFSTNPANLCNEYLGLIKGFTVEKNRFFLELFIGNYLKPTENGYILDHEYFANYRLVIEDVAYICGMVWQDKHAKDKFPAMAYFIEECVNYLIYTHYISNREDLFEPLMKKLAEKYDT